jgi:hypothetical protein
VVGIESGDLTAEVARLVCVLVIHVVRYADFCEYTWMHTHVLGAFFADCCKLMREAVSYGILAKLDGKCRCEIFSP